MRDKFRFIGLATLLIVGCTATKTSRDYVIVNKTGSIITNLTIPNANPSSKSWGETLPDQGWTFSSPRSYGSLTLTWTDDTGSHEASFVEQKTSNRLHAEFYIELKPNGQLTGRLIEPPPQDGQVWAFLALVPIYFLYCLVVVLVVGVPLALAIMLAYMLFQGIRQGSTSLVEGLSGDNTVFQFSIREVLMLMTVIGLALGWFMTIMRP